MKSKSESTNPTSVFKNIGWFLGRAFRVYLAPYKLQWGLVALSVVVSLTFDTSITLSLKYLFDTVIKSGDSTKLARLIGGLASLFLLSAFGDVLNDYLSADMGRCLLRDLRVSVFKHLQVLPAEYYDRVPSGDILTYFSQDLPKVKGILVNLLPKGVFAISRLIINLVLLINLEWRLTLIVAALSPFYLIAPEITARRVVLVDSNVRRKNASIIDLVSESVTAQQLLRALGIQNQIVTNFIQYVGSWGPVRKSAPFIKSLPGRLTDLQQSLVNVLVIGVGAYLAFQGTLTVGAFTSFVAALSKVGSAASSLLKFFSGMTPAINSLRRVEAFLNETAGVVEPQNPIVLPRITQGLRFEGVDFGYKQGTLVLHQVDLSVPIKQFVTFVGYSGAGKSTLLKLLTRLYDPNAGLVSVDGYDLRAVSLRAFTSHLGVVFQNPVLFNTTIRENIALSKPDCSDADIEQAARAAQIHDTIMGMSRGYQTLVGEGGQHLSQGQRQRIALASALLRDPDILILDEVTSALDPETEATVNEMLQGLAQNKTVIMMTHRLAVATGADQIYVLDKGRVVEHGTHSVLMGAQGLYAQLWQRQHGFTISADGHHATVTPERLCLIPLFANLTKLALTALANQFVTEYYRSGQVIFEEGDPGNKFYIIARGKVEVSVQSFEGQAMPVEVSLDGDYFGEIALIEECPRTATVTAILPTLLLTLQRERFLKMMEDFPTVREAIEQIMLGRDLRTLITRGRRARAGGALDKLESLNFT